MPRCSGGSVSPSARRLVVTVAPARWCRHPSATRSSTRPTDARLVNGYFFLPTIFDHCERAMGIVREERFGPILTVERFAATAEAIALGNDTEYGLAAGVRTADAELAVGSLEHCGTAPSGSTTSATTPRPRNGVGSRSPATVASWDPPIWPSTRRPSTSGSTPRRHREAGSAAGPDRRTTSRHHHGEPGQEGPHARDRHREAPVSPSVASSTMSSVVVVRPAASPSGRPPRVSTSGPRWELPAGHRQRAPVGRQAGEQRRRGQPARTRRTRPASRHAPGRPLRRRSARRGGGRHPHGGLQPRRDRTAGGRLVPDQRGRERPPSCPARTPTCIRSSVERTWRCGRAAGPARS